MMLLRFGEISIYFSFRYFVTMVFLLHEFINAASFFFLNNILFQVVISPWQNYHVAFFHVMNLYQRRHQVPILIYPWQGHGPGAKEQQYIPSPPGPRTFWHMI